MATGRLGVTPLTRDRMDPTSIDLTLGNMFRFFKKMATVNTVQ